MNRSRPNSLRGTHTESVHADDPFERLIVIVQLLSLEEPAVDKTTLVISTIIPSRANCHLFLTSGPDWFMWHGNHNARQFRVPQIPRRRSAVINNLTQLSAVIAPCQPEMAQRGRLTDGDVMRIVNSIGHPFEGSM